MSNSQSTRIIGHAAKLILSEGLQLTGSDGLTIPSSTVTQATSVTTAVTINAVSGVITTFSQSAAADATVSFTVNNSTVESTDKILATITNYAGAYSTNGIPIVSVGTIASGSFVINVSNVHASNALSGALKISFVVLK